MQEVDIIIIVLVTVFLCSVIGELLFGKKKGKMVYGCTYCKKNCNCSGRKKKEERDV